MTRQTAPSVAAGTTVTAAHLRRTLVTGTRLRRTAAHYDLTTRCNDLVVDGPPRGDAIPLRDTTGTLTWLPLPHGVTKHSAHAITACQSPAGLSFHTDDGRLIVAYTITKE